MSPFTPEEHRLIESLRKVSRPLKPHVQCGFTITWTNQNGGGFCVLQYADIQCRPLIPIKFIVKERIDLAVINMKAVKRLSISP